MQRLLEALLQRLHHKSSNLKPIGCSACQQAVPVSPVSRQPGPNWEGPNLPHKLLLTCSDASRAGGLTWRQLALYELHSGYPEQLRACAGNH